MRLFLARHGESEANVQGVYWNGTEGNGLTETGRGQAAQLADSLSDVRFSALYCSPILRARQTTEIIACRLHIPVEIEEGLREYDVGILEGMPYSRARTEIYWQVVTEWMEKMNPEARIEGGESYHDIQARFLPFVRRLEGTYGQTEANILAISHGGTLRCMLPAVVQRRSRVLHESPHWVHNARRRRTVGRRMGVHPVGGRKGADRKGVGPIQGSWNGHPIACLSHLR